MRIPAALGHSAVSPREFAATRRIFAYTDNSFPDVLAIRTAAIKVSIYSTEAVSCFIS